MSDNVQSEHSYTENLKSGNTSDEEVKEEVEEPTTNITFQTKTRFKSNERRERDFKNSNDGGETQKARSIVSEKKTNVEDKQNVVISEISYTKKEKMPSTASSRFQSAQSKSPENKSDDLKQSKLT